MADLTLLEKRQLERLLGMGTGYVLNFSNRTFADFVTDSVARNIYDCRYVVGSGSKANLLRGFVRAEHNHVVAKLLNDLLDYAERECGVHADGEDLTASRRTVARLRLDSPIADVEVLATFSAEDDFETVAKAVREAIDHNRPEAGLDRLHTFIIKYVRLLCEGSGVTVVRDKPLHSLFGEYVKRLRDAGQLESEMTARILKSSISVLEAFNDVRNNQSLANDNTVLNYDEALLIFNHILNCVRFLRELEARRSRVLGQSTSADLVDDDIPF